MDDHRERYGDPDGPAYPNGYDRCNLGGQMIEDYA